MIWVWSKFQIQIFWYRFNRGHSFLLTPYQSPPEPLDTSITALVCILSSILKCNEANQHNSLIKGWKCRSRKFFKAIFCHQRNNKKAGRLSMKFFSISVQVHRGAYIPYFKINAPILCCPLFFEKYRNPQVKINKVINKDTEITTLQYSFRINLKDTFSHIFMDSLEGCLSTEYLLNFFSNLYIPPWLRTKFKFMLLRLLVNAFVSQEMNLFSFTHFPM